MLGGIGTPGIILLVILALLLFGPHKLPELGRAVGRTFREFKAGASEIMETPKAKDSEVQQADATRNEQDNKRLPE
ncbi:twin-arginine translocase TatA/TatE family subunit [Paenibacillus sp. FA6]|uniref:twin-arginine translocase TatA/TatE family subunit n=1 Tax=Paenibacillus sp. FA6 TaxID=3413029 RepID=UPI003F65C79B